MDILVKGLENPFVVPSGPNKLEAFGLLEFVNGEHEDIVVSFMTRAGTMYDDLGRVKCVVEALKAAGFDIVPTAQVKFSTFTAEEAAVIEQRVTVTERKNPNG